MPALSDSHGLDSKNGTETKIKAYTEKCVFMDLIKVIFFFLYLSQELNFSSDINHRHMFLSALSTFFTVISGAYVLQKHKEINKGLAALSILFSDVL